MRADGTADHLSTPGGQLIGALPDARLATTTFRLGSGATLLLHTAASPRRTPLPQMTATATKPFSNSAAPPAPPPPSTAIRALLDNLGTGVDDTAVLAISVPNPDDEEQ